MLASITLTLGIRLDILASRAIAPSRTSLVSAVAPPFDALSNRRSSFSSDAMGAYDSAPPQNGALSYEELCALERQTDQLYQKEMLSGVYDERRRCFAITGGAKRYSITSTCFALLALDAEPERWHSAAAGRASARLDHLQVDAVLEALLVAEWRESDLYQAATIVTALRLIDPRARTLRALPAVHWRVASAIETLIDNRPMRRNGRKQPVGAYLRYCSARALMLLLAPPAEVEAASAACPVDAPPGSCPSAAQLLASAHPDAALPAARQGGADARQEVRSCHCSTGRTALVRHSKTVHLYSPLLSLPSGGRGGAPRARAVGRDGVRRPLPPARLPCGVR